MIRVENLIHDYTGEGTNAVDDVSFEVQTGEIFGFLGPSGAGKSTVQGILTGLLRLQRGQVSYDDLPVTELRSSFFNRIGVSFEHPNLYQKLTGLENLQYYAGLYDVPTEDPMMLLERVGLAEHAHIRAGSFSKGMKQRLVFCRSMINKPEILFLDEPTSGLDPSTAEVIKGIIRERRETGTTIFLTTHNMLTADQLCDNIAFINEGKIVAMDSPKALKLAYGERSVEVEYREDGKIASRVFFLDKDADRAGLKEIIEGKDILTMHSREASLEQIFIQMTGRGLV
jgi:fluoroquinolone transport system ATP-binding protein